jgi:hypothetical protein
LSLIKIRGGLKSIELDKINLSTKKIIELRLLVHDFFLKIVFHEPVGVAQ